MGRSSLVSVRLSSNNMSSKTLLFLLGAFVLFALSEALSEEEGRDIQKVDTSVKRVVREAEAGKRKGRRKVIRRKNKRGKKRPSKVLKNKKNKRRRANKKQTKKNCKKGRRCNRNRRRKQRKNKKVRQGSPSPTPAGDADEQCVELAAKYSRAIGGVVSNFRRQKNRILNAFKKQANNKNNKRTLFEDVANQVVTAGGGDKNSLSCGGSTSNSGATQLKNLTDFLFACEASINTVCKESAFPAINMTQMDECTALTDDFERVVLQECFVTQDCMCWKNESLTMKFRMIRDMCVIVDLQSQYKAQFGLCTAAFSKCRRYEDDSVEAVAACSQTSSSLLNTAKALSANSKAMTKANTTLTSLKSSRRLQSTSRTRRATATTCAEVISKTQEIISASSSDTSNTTIATLSAEVSGATSITDCTDAQKSTISDLIDDLDSAIDDVDEALSAVQELLETLTGSTASTSELESSSTATAKSSGRKGRIVRDLLRNMH